MFLAAGSGPEYQLGVQPQSVKGCSMPAQCASQILYSLTPDSAITMTAIKAPAMIQPST